MQMFSKTVLSLTFVVSIALSFASGILTPAQASAFTCQSLFRDATLVSDRKIEVPSLEKGPGFVIPNENTIGFESPNFSSVIDGIYVSVGTERSFMGAALMAGRATAVIMADVDGRVTLFNRVNKALLALAESREAYGELRLRSSFEELQQKIAASRTDLAVDNLEILTSREVWAWWRSMQKISDQWVEFNNPSTAGFKGANYLYEDAAFARVAQLAKNNRIIVIQTDLASPDFSNRVRAVSHLLGQRVSLLDLSNAWEMGYLGHERTASLIERLDAVLSPQSQVIFTYRAAALRTEGHPTIFRFRFMSRGSGPVIQDLALGMNNMEMMDPSRRDHQDPRAARYRRFDRGGF